MIAMQHVLKVFLLLAASVIPGHDEPAEFQKIRLDMPVIIIHGDPVTEPSPDWEIFHGDPVTAPAPEWEI